MLGSRVTVYKTCSTARPPGATTCSNAEPRAHPPYPFSSHNLLSRVSVERASPKTRHGAPLVARRRRPHRRRCGRLIAKRFRGRPRRPQREPFQRPLHRLHLYRVAAWPRLEGRPTEERPRIKRKETFRLSRPRLKGRPTDKEIPDAEHRTTGWPVTAGEEAPSARWPRPATAPTLQDARLQSIALWGVSATKTAKAAEQACCASKATAPRS